MAAVVFLDANVLYPAALRDLLIQLGLAGLIEPHWSDQVHDEWICALLRMRHDLSPAALQRTREMMDQALPGANIGTVTVGDAIAALPDPNDRHVLAGAVASSASLILTFNMRDFPGSVLEPHGIAAVHPDHFLALLAGATPAEFLAAVRTVRARLRREIAATDYLAGFARIGLPLLAGELSKHAADL